MLLASRVPPRRWLEYPNNESRGWRGEPIGIRTLTSGKGRSPDRELMAAARRRYPAQWPNVRARCPRDGQRMKRVKIPGSSHSHLRAGSIVGAGGFEPPASAL